MQKYYSNYKDEIDIEKKRLKAKMKLLADILQHWASLQSNCV